MTSVNITAAHRVKPRVLVLVKKLDTKAFRRTLSLEEYAQNANPD